MDEQLKEQLRELSLLPSNSRLQINYWSQEIDQTKSERHFPPGTPEGHMELHEQIESDVLLLSELELHKQEKTPEYISLELQIRDQLQQIRTYQMLEPSTRLPLTTGKPKVYARDYEGLRPQRDPVKS